LQHRPHEPLFGQAVFKERDFSFAKLGFEEALIEEIVSFLDQQ